MRPPGRRTAMCGIFGYVGQSKNAADLVLRGLKKLEYRGYDSWGVAVGHHDRVVVEKRIGKIGEAAPDLPASAIGIGHTRWATHGGVTAHNAHPHLDCADRLAVLLSRERCRVFDADTGGGRRSASRHGTQEILLGAAVLA